MNGEAAELAKDISSLTDKLGSNPATGKAETVASVRHGSCRICGRDILNAISKIATTRHVAELAELIGEPGYIETLNLGDYAEKVDRSLVNAYKTCNLQNFPETRFRLGELKKDIIKDDWATAKSRLDDIKLRLYAALEKPD